MYNETRTQKNIDKVQRLTTDYSVELADSLIVTVSVGMCHMGCENIVSVRLLEVCRGKTSRTLLQT